MEIRDSLYTMRFVFSIIGGTIAGFLKYGLEQAGFVIFIATLIYLVTVYYAYFKYRKQNLKPDLKVIFLEGLGSYIIFWLLVWIIIYNVLIFY